MAYEEAFKKTTELLETSAKGDRSRSSPPKYDPSLSLVSLLPRVSTPTRPCWMKYILRPTVPSRMMKSKGWNTSKRSFVSTAVTKLGSALAKRGMLATRLRQLKLTISWTKSKGKEGGGGGCGNVRALHVLVKSLPP